MTSTNATFMEIPVADRVYGIRTCKSDLTSSREFQWKEGWNQCSDWKPEAECGNGLHFIANGVGAADLLNWSPESKWLVVYAHKDKVVDIDRKVKAPEVFCEKVFDLPGQAFDYLYSIVGVMDGQIMGSSNQTGDRGSSNQTGDRGSSNQTGDRGSSNQTGDMGSSNQTGYMGSSNQTGYMGSSNQTGYMGSSNQTGYMGSSNQTGYMGSSAARGEHGQATAHGEGSRVLAGVNGIIQLKYFDGSRYRLVTGYTGEEGIKAFEWYSLDSGKKFKQVIFDYSHTGISPDDIQSVSDDEVFVFGSNLLGQHVGGAARVALEKFGALTGYPVGLSGNSYAIPTMSEEIKPLPLSVIQGFVINLLQQAYYYSHLTFFVTRIGCGIAGYKDEEVAELFYGYDIPSNVCLPQSFVDHLITRSKKAVE
jgi:hypothetical protein